LINFDSPEHFICGKEWGFNYNPPHIGTMISIMKYFKIAAGPSHTVNHELVDVGVYSSTQIITILQGNIIRNQKDPSPANNDVLIFFDAL